VSVNRPDLACPSRFRALRAKIEAAGGTVAIGARWSLARTLLEIGPRIRFQSKKMTNNLIVGTSASLSQHIHLSARGTKQQFCKHEIVSVR
jgi:hypothetical protein